MKKRNVIIIICAMLLICTGTALAFNLSAKKSEPKIGSYNKKFVGNYVSENKTNEQEKYDEMTIPYYSENELIIENQGCFNLGTDAGRNVSSGFRTDFLERMVKMFPDPLVRENEDYLYLVYNTENKYRLFLFYSKEKTNGIILDGYPIVLKEKRLYKDFSEIAVGDSIEKVGCIDKIIPLYIQIFDLLPETYYERNKENGKYFSSIHLLSDGILKIDYDRKGEDYIVVSITYGEDFVLEGEAGDTCYKIFEEDYIG
jgi:hypothetical protein